MVPKRALIAVMVMTVFDHEEGVKPCWMRSKTLLDTASCGNFLAELQLSKIRRHVSRLAEKSRSNPRIGMQPFAPKEQQFRRYKAVLLGHMKAAAAIASTWSPRLNRHKRASMALAVPRIATLMDAT